MHAMATHQRSVGCPVDRDINPHIEDTEGINTGPLNENESTSDSDTATVFGGSETDGQANELIPSNEAKLTALKRELHDVHQ